MSDFSEEPVARETARRMAFPEAEEQLRLLVENLRDYAVFTMDSQGRVAGWNPGAERIQGYRADECIREVRTISYLLYPPMLEEMGLQMAIEWHVEGFTRRSGIQVDCEVQPDMGRLPRDIEVAVFRVFQESLTNVHRHSGSPTAQVRLWPEEANIVLEVKDEGKGAPPGVLEFSGEALGTLGVGLRGMNERVRQLGGKLELSSSEKGMTLRAVIPTGAAGSVQRRG